MGYNSAVFDYQEVGGTTVLGNLLSNTNQYKYNGKEFQDELGLNLYDMDFRDYDPAIARWTGIDPVTHHNMSPYMAFDGNPVFWADPSGADSTDGNTLDIFGRDRFDTNGMYIPFSERGVGSFDEYLSQDGGGFGGMNVIVVDGNCAPNDSALENNLIAIQDIDSSVLVIQALNLENFYSQLKAGLDGKMIANLTFLSHGDYKNTGIFIGSDYLSKNSEFVSLGMNLKPYMTSSSKIALSACHIGSGHNPASSSKMLQGLSNNSGAAVFANMTWGMASKNRFNNSNLPYIFSQPNSANFQMIPIQRKGNTASSPNAVQNLGNWLYLQPNQPSIVIQGVYFTSSGRIKF